MDNKKMIPVGIEDFREIRQRNFYYIDKTVMIRDLLRSWGLVNLFTRPRRFGKSLSMSMLKCFFEIGTDPALFDGLRIAEEKELCKEYLGQYPVVSVTLKGVEGTDYESARFFPSQRCVSMSISAFLTGRYGICWNTMI